MPRLMEVMVRLSKIKLDGVESRKLPTVTGLITKNTDPEKVSNAMIRLLIVTRSSTSAICIGKALENPKPRKTMPE